jgi:hypothetical protein
MVNLLVGLLLGPVLLQTEISIFTLLLLVRTFTQLVQTDGVACQITHNKQHNDNDHKFNDSGVSIV